MGWLLAVAATSPASPSLLVFFGEWVEPVSDDFVLSMGVFGLEPHSLQVLSLESALELSIVLLSDIYILGNVP